MSSTTENPNDPGDGSQGPNKRPFEEIRTPSKKARTPKKKKANAFSIMAGRLPEGTPALGQGSPAKLGSGNQAIAPINDDDDGSGDEQGPIKPLVLNPFGQGGTSTTAPASVEDGGAANTSAHTGEGVADLDNPFTTVAGGQATGNASLLAVGMEGIQLDPAADADPSGAPPNGGEIPANTWQAPALPAGVAWLQNTGAQLQANAHPAPVLHNTRPGQNVIPPTNIPDVHVQEFIIRAVQDNADAQALTPNDPANAIMAWPMASRSITALQQRSIIDSNTDFVNVPNAVTKRLRNLNAGNNNLEKTTGPHVTRYVVTDDDSTGRLQALVNERIINTPAFTLVAIPLPIVPGPFLSVIADAYEIRPTPRHITILTEAIKAALLGNATIGGLIDTYHDRIASVNPPNAYTRQTAMSALASSIRIRHIGPVPDMGTEWAVFWDPPTRSTEGEQHLFNAFRRIPIEVERIGQIINEYQAPAVTCAICHFHDHTTPFCPFANVPGWVPPFEAVNNGNNQGGRGGRGGFVNRARGGVRGRGRGGRGRGA